MMSKQRGAGRKAPTPPPPEPRQQESEFFDKLPERTAEGRTTFGLKWNGPDTLSINGTNYRRLDKLESEGVVVEIFALRHSQRGPLEAEFGVGDLDPEGIAAALGLTKEYQQVVVQITRIPDGDE